jgi:predicted nucleotidyltransferase
LQAAPTLDTSAPRMSTVTPSHTVATALFGKTQRALLALFFGRPEQSLYFRQIVRTAGLGQGAAQRELARWVEAGILVLTRRGNQVFFQANTASPVFAELQALTVKTVGVAEVLGEALAGLRKRITVAFLYGSLAQGTGKASSDVDVMVIGKAGFGEVVAALQGAQKTIGREVNPTVYSEQEYRTKRRAKHHFLNAVLDTPKVFLVGGEHELGRLAYPRMTSRTIPTVSSIVNPVVSSLASRGSRARDVSDTFQAHDCSRSRKPLSLAGAAILSARTCRALTNKVTIP